MRSPSTRQLRAGELVRHALTEVLAREEFADPALAGQSITVSEVRVSPDLKHATAFCAPLGGENMDEVVAGLNRARGFLRGRLSREVDLRYTPTLRFMGDESFDEGSRMDNLLNSLDIPRDAETDKPE